MISTRLNKKKVKEYAKMKSLCAPIVYFILEIFERKDFQDEYETKSLHSLSSYVPKMNTRLQTRVIFFKIFLNEDIHN